LLLIHPSRLGTGADKTLLVARLSGDWLCGANPSPQAWAWTCFVSGKGAGAKKQFSGALPQAKVLLRCSGAKKQFSEALPQAKVLLRCSKCSQRSQNFDGKIHLSLSGFSSFSVSPNNSATPPRPLSRGGNVIATLCY